MRKNKKKSNNTDNKKQNFVKNDGFMNVLTSLGVVGKDQTQTTFYAPDCKISPQMLDLMYYGNGLVKTIVQIVPEEMLSKGFVVEGDENNFVQPKLESLDAISKIMEMFYWSRLYGGGIIVMGLDDGRDLDMPVDVSTLRNVNYLHVFDRYQVNQGLMPMIDKDINSPNYGLPLYYNIQFNLGDGSYEYLEVHHSRVLRADGIILPARLRSANQYWGESEIQACMSEVKSFGALIGNISALTHRFAIPIFGIKGLAESLNCENEKNVERRISFANTGISNLNMVVKDTEETFDIVSTPLSGISDIIDRFMMNVSSVTRIPVSLLFGRSAAGLNSTGEYDTNAFYDYICQQQKKKLLPVLEKLVRYIMLSKDGDFNGIQPENWSIVFNPLMQNSPIDDANFKHRIAEIDEKYINLGVLEPNEVRNSRYGSGVYSDLTTLDNESDLQEEYAEQGNLEDEQAIQELYRKMDALNGKKEKEQDHKGKKASISSQLGKKISSLFKTGPKKH